MIRPLQIFAHMSRLERWALCILSATFVLSLFGLCHAFYLENTVLAPTTGGTYIEGSVGQLQSLSPWFTVQNDVNRDIVSLVFSGLLRYNPQTRKIEEDLATMKVDAGNKVYTLTLKEGLLWQDSTAKDPHPVTADDVVFTFKTVQDPEFPNPLLQQNFQGVKIEKLDERTVQFTLDQPYSFFPSNLTLGLVPAKSFANIPVSKLALDLGGNPVGAGPYRIKNIVQTDLSSEVTLERFDRAMEATYKLDRIVFRIYPDYSTLLSDLRNLQGVRLVAKNDNGTPQIPKRFEASNYYLPQYVALFFNMDRKILQNQKLRLGLQLGTNKQEVTGRIGETVIVDTPLLEIDVADKHYQFDPSAAQEALQASNWVVPEQQRLTHLSEMDEAGKTGVLHLPALALAPQNGPLTLTGSWEGVMDGSTLNGVPLETDLTASGSWRVQLPMRQGTGALKTGENLLRLMSKNGKTQDSSYLFIADTSDILRRAQEERALAARVSSSPGIGSRLSAADLTLEQGMLRLRKPSDPVSIRRNSKGEQLTLHLLTSNAPKAYVTVADEIKKEWARLGVEIAVETPATRTEFEERLLRRDYDIVLFGQSLLDNLDSYPYWHSSGAQKLTGQERDLRQDAYNLSQYKSFKADDLLETVRRTSDDKERQDALAKLSSLLKDDVPAVFLYSPLYTYAHRQNVLGIQLGSLSLHSDRFLTLSNWYVREDRRFLPGKSWGSIFGWIGNQFTGKK